MFFLITCNVPSTFQHTHERCSARRILRIGMQQHPNETCAFRMTQLRPSVLSCAVKERTATKKFSGGLS
ncbi:hypothetical protein SBA5_440003 [Candidatus Sulfotelmatomonas gaucii]|uniref:Uncharacterized protein n=1 Tax=Candidatus Sulfuritelmatomonas gaucii TaxID=2043161 RepID=A0A2N9LM72_9BACT|nr:hypothetical protein SBA5_440003 [Candidatus Sulfotelmatomonas gaucii]